MAFQEYCFTWIIQIRDQLSSYFTIYKAPLVEPLPENVIFEILSRLPAQRVSVFRTVCKKWLELTSTYDFAHIHLQRHCSINSEKVLLLQCVRIFTLDYLSYEAGCDSFFVLNKESKGKILFKKMPPDLNRPREVFPFLYGSCNSILVFKPQVWNDMNYLLNPTTHERINIRCNGGTLCGFFYHPSENKYVLLYIRTSFIDGMFDYFLFSLESESLKKVCTFPYYSTSNQVYSKGALYWIIDYKSNNKCENSVMKYNVENRVFNSFPHPGEQCMSTCRRPEMWVLENTGQLLFCRRYMDYMDIWVLKDDQKNIWVKRYNVHLDWDLKLYPFETRDELKQLGYTIRVLYVDNGELLFFWINRGFFMYNLEEKRVRKIDPRGMKLEGKLGYVLSASCYVKSLVSLKVPMKHPNSGKFPTYGQITFDLKERF